MAVPSFVAKEDWTQFGNSVPITIPATASAGQRLVVVLALRWVSGGGMSSAPAGLTLTCDGSATESSGSHLFVYTGVVTSGGGLDPGASINFSLLANMASCVSALVYEASDILDADILPYSVTAAATRTTPALTAPAEGRLLHVYGDLSNASSTIAHSVTWTPHASTTERSDNGYNSSSGRLPTFMVADESATAGTTPTRTATPSETVRGRAAALLLGTTVSKPVANAGPDQGVAAAAAVNLDGSATDGGGAGAPYTYAWTQTSGATVVLNDATAENPSFTAPSVTDTLVFSLVVTDTGSVASDPDTVTINVAGPGDAVVPVSNVTVTSWTTDPSGQVFEVLADNDDSTFAVSSEDPTGLVLRVNLGAMNTPAGTDAVTLSVRVRRQNASSATATLQLIEGVSTVIATTGAVAVAAGDDFAFVNLTLSQAEIESVTASAWEGDLTTSDLDANLIVTAAA